MARIVFVSLLFIIVFSLFISATEPTYPELHVKSKLYFSGIPLINKPVEVILELSSNQAIENVSAKIIEK